MDTQEIRRDELGDDVGGQHYAEALRESETRLRTLIDAMPDLVCFKDGDGRWLVANDSMIRVLQLQTVEYVGKSDAEIAACVPFFKKYLQLAQRTDEDAWCKRAPHAGEEAIPNLDGQPQLFEVTRVPLFHGDGRRNGLLVLGREVTRRKMMEEELLRSRKLDSLAVLAGGIAHDFNNILTVIMGNISLSRIVADTDRQLQDWLSRAEAASLKAKELVEQLLVFARSGTPLKKPVKISDLLRETANFVVRGSNVRCTFAFPEQLRQVVVDEGQLGQVLHNIIVNADQAMPEGGLIHISAENLDILSGESNLLPAGSYIRIAIQDQGVGIDRRYLHKIFDPYFSTKQKGCGLGLAIAYSIIKNHQGEITVESQLGMGSTFFITLPAIAEQALPPLTEAPPRPSGTPRILLLEDEPMVRQVAGDMLANLGYSAAFAIDGVQAVEQYQEAMTCGAPFAAVILDLTIPGGLGARQTIPLLRKIDPGVKAVVASGYTSEPILAQHREYGFAAAISKPFSLEQLGALLSRVLAEPAPDEPEGGAEDLPVEKSEQE